MKKTFLIITSIAEKNNPVLVQIATESSAYSVPFIVIGDKKSPEDFNLKGCDYYSTERQQTLNFRIIETLPYNHYARKNLGYLIAMSEGAEIIIETDDDNYPLKDFWIERERVVNAHLLKNKSWVNIYKYFSESNIWPRGFPLEYILNKAPELENQVGVYCPIQQGLADGNPDVDAIYRLVVATPVVFEKSENIALGINSFCPFNSQNTTWFKEAFPLLYLPSYCSFRMTDIWRSFIAQRISWTCGWQILFHHSTMHQVRNEHRLMNDFRDELPGYFDNILVFKNLMELSLEPGIEKIHDNILKCYQVLIGMKLIDQKELLLLNEWLEDIKSFNLSGTLHLQ